MSPGELDRAREELGDARGALRSARLLHEAGELRDATSRAYYAAFHAARAALTVKGRHAKAHSGQIDAFKRVHGEGEILEAAFELRLAADYGSDEKFTADSEKGGALIDDVERFVERCERICEEAAERGPDEPDPPPDL